MADRPSCLRPTRECFYEPVDGDPEADWPVGTNPHVTYLHLEPETRKQWEANRRELGLPVPGDAVVHDPDTALSTDALDDVPVRGRRVKPRSQNK